MNQFTAMFGLKKLRKTEQIKSTTEKAYEIRERRDQQMMRTACVQEGNHRDMAILDHPLTTRSRRENFYKKIPDLVKLEDVVSVVVSNCQGPSGCVVSLTDADGKTTTLWIDERLKPDRSLPVRSLTAY